MRAESSPLSGDSGASRLDPRQVVRSEALHRGQLIGSRGVDDEVVDARLDVGLDEVHAGLGRCPRIRGQSPVAPGQARRPAARALVGPGLGGCLRRPPVERAAQGRRIPADRPAVLVEELIYAPGSPRASRGRPA